MCFNVVHCGAAESIISEAEKHKTIFIYLGMMFYCIFAVNVTISVLLPEANVRENLNV